MTLNALIKLSRIALLSGAFFLNPPAYANEVLVNFEAQPAQEYPSGSTLEIITPDLTVKISRPGATFGIVKPPDGPFGERTLAPHPFGSSFIADFSKPVKHVSFDIGDTFANQVSVTAYPNAGAQGEALETQTSMCCSEVGFSTGTMTVSAPDIMSISFHATSLSLATSVAYDNFTLALAQEALDEDNDGIVDDQDSCKDSDLRPSVVIDGCDSEVSNATWYLTGCTTSDYITACAKNAKNHGHFVKCVNEFTKSVKDNGFLNRGDKDSLTSCAAQAKLP
jgi:hypothetical protein